MNEKSDGWTYQISPKMIERYLNWSSIDSNHQDCHKKYSGAIGGHITFEFTPTSIGTIANAYCAHCKQRICLSDFENW